MKSNSKDDNDSCEGKIWYSAWSQAHQREYYWTTLKVHGADGETTFKIYSKCQWVMPDNNKIFDVTMASSLAAPGNRCVPCIASGMPPSQSSPVNRNQQTAIMVQKTNKIRKSHRRQQRSFIAVVAASIAFVIAPIILGGAGFDGELSSLSNFRPRILLENHQSSNSWIETFWSNFFDYFFAIPAGHAVSEDGSLLYECMSETITQPEQSNARSYIAEDDSGRDITRTSLKHNVPVATLPIDKSKGKMVEHTFDEDVSFSALRYNTTRNENAYASEKSASSGSTHSVKDCDESDVLVDEQKFEKVQDNGTAVKWNNRRKRCFVPLFYVLSKTCRVEPPFEDLEHFLLQCMMQ